MQRPCGILAELMSREGRAQLTRGLVKFYSKYDGKKDNLDLS